jgi:hypothetical protein
MKKLGLIILAVIMALGLVGVAFASWSSTLTATATVTDATFNPVFGGSPVTGAPLGLYGNYSISGNGTKTLTVTVGNAYPGLAVSIPITVNSGSSIPVNVSIAETDNFGVYDSPNTINVSAPTYPSPIAVSPGYETSNLVFTLDNNIIPAGVYTIILTITATSP